MAQDKTLRAQSGDAFSPIANYYDAIMEHVDYARWRYITKSLATLLPHPLCYLDAGCGTGVLMEQLVMSGWNSSGIDLSPAMLRVARHRRKLESLAQADLCALPFREQFHLITCLFDSLNFLLREDLVLAALASFQQALFPGGLLYFDVVTRKMITDHFNNESWVENHGRFSSFWRSTYDGHERLCETRVRINSGSDSVTYERVYDEGFICEAIARSSLTLLTMRDAYTWGKVGKRTTRIDFVAVKGDKQGIAQKFQELEQHIRDSL